MRADGREKLNAECQRAAVHGEVIKELDSRAKYAVKRDRRVFYVILLSILRSCQNRASSAGHVGTLLGGCNYTADVGIRMTFPRAPCSARPSIRSSIAAWASAAFPSAYRAPTTGTNSPEMNPAPRIPAASSCSKKFCAQRKQPMTDASLAIASRGFTSTGPRAPMTTMRPVAMRDASAGAP